MKYFVISFIALSLGWVIFLNSATTPLVEFSEGDRVGVLRKFSKKGIFNKTYEGELMLNAGLGSVKLDTFKFSVDDSEIASILTENIGKNIIVSYKQYLVVPYKIGSTSYIVNSVKLE